jgi:outer membrane protein assembly factor BamA
VKIGSLILLLLSALLFSSCSVTRRMAPDEYLLTRNRITFESTAELSRTERIPPGELSRYIQQRPNKRLFGIPFYLQIYNLSAPDRQNWTKRIGEPPAVYNPGQTARSVDALSIYLRGHGFFRSSVEAVTDTLSGHRIRVEYRIQTGKPSRIGTMAYDFLDDFVEPIIRQDSAQTLIHTGDLFNVDRLQEERQRITGNLKNQGFYNFSINNIGYIADTVTSPEQIDLTMRIRRHATGFDASDRPILENNRVYRLRNIYIQPDYNTERVLRDSLWFTRLDTLEYRGVYFLYHREMNVRPDVLMRAVNLYPNDLYDASAINRAYDNLMKLNYFRNANILFTELTDSLSGLITYVGDQGEGIATREGFLDCTIRCTPGTRQSYSVDLEAATTSTYYGLLTTLGYQNRNLLKGAESIDFSVTAGYEVMRVPGRKNSIELGGAVGVTFPRFVAPLRIDRYNRLQNARTRVELSVSYQDRPFYRRTLTSASWGYSWRNRKYGSFTLRPVDISVINTNTVDSAFLNTLKNRYLKESFKSQLLLGLSASYIYNNQTSGLDRNSFRLRLNGETNGNLLDLTAPLVASRSSGEDFYRVFGIRYAQYVRGDLDLSYQFALGLKTALAARFYIGAGHTYGNSRNTSIPFERLFYAGGPNSMRGWQTRTLGPGGMDRQSEGDTQTTDYPAYVANFKLETNLELRFPVYRFLNGAVFADLGNIWQIGRRPAGDDPEAYFRFSRFYDQLGLDTGLGARFDFDFFLFRVDWGIRLHDPNQPVGQKWMKQLTLRQTAFSFSVGYPF